MSAHQGKSRSVLIAEIEALQREVKELRLTESGKKIISLREAMRRAQAASVAKTHFLTNMSHELRTPMTSILACTEMLLDDDEIEKAPPDRIELLRALRRNGQHLTRILSDILDLAKIEAGRLEVECTQTRLVEILQDLESVMGASAREKGLAFDVSLEGHLPKTVDTDPTRLRQILMNLLGNAIKFTQRGGVRLGVGLRHTDTGAVLCFSVSDTGCGMPPATLDEVFEPFSQGDTSTTRSAGGTGLGLPISRELARLLGGDLVAESIEGEGSTFRLMLPIGDLAEHELCDPEEIPTEHPASQAAETTLQLMNRIRQAGPSARILLVEDGADNQLLLSQILRKAGFSVTCAANGQEGVAVAIDRAAGDAAFDLILMDMQMPIMDGYEATRALRDRQLRTPIVALTAHAMVGDRERCLEAGCDDFVTKPVERRTLIEAVLRNLGRGYSGSDDTADGARYSGSLSSPSRSSRRGSGSG